MHVTLIDSERIPFIARQPFSTDGWTVFSVGERIRTRQKSL